MSPELWQRFVEICNAVVRGQAALVQIHGTDGLPHGLICTLRDGIDAVEAQPLGIVLSEPPNALRLVRSEISRFEPGRN